MMRRSRPFPVPCWSSRGAPSSTSRRGSSWGRATGAKSMRWRNKDPLGEAQQRQLGTCQYMSISYNYIYMINQDTSLPITISHLFIANWGGIDTPNSTRVSIIVFFWGEVSGNCGRIVCQKGRFRLKPILSQFPSKTLPSCGCFST